MFEKKDNFTVKAIPCAKGLYIDVAGCGLRCATCPRGGVAGLSNNNKGLMSFEMFQRIISKFIKEEILLEELMFGNWGDPLLNPDLARMIGWFRAVEKHVWPSRRIPIWVSTNLNHLKNPEELLCSGLDLLNISISGMRHTVYSRNHRGGDIKLVLRNILKLAKLRSAMGLKRVQLKVLFLEFVYNTEDLRLTRKFCETYGLDFGTYKGFVMTVEENVRLLNQNDPLTAVYRQFIDLEKDAALAEMNLSDQPCLLRDRYVTINFDGQLYRCCFVFHEKHFLGSFLKFQIKDIPCIKSNICLACSGRPRYHSQWPLRSVPVMVS